MAAKSYTDGQVVSEIKSGTTIPKAAAKFGVGSKEMALAYYRLEPVADPSLVISGTKAQVAAAIVAGRKSGLRWERLVARSGLKVGEVKRIYTAKTGVDADLTYAGTGRHFELTRPNAAKPKATRAARTATPNATAGKATGRKPAAKPAAKKPAAKTGRKPAATAKS